MNLKFRLCSLFVLAVPLFWNTACAATPTIFAPGVISGPLSDAVPAFTPDGKTVFFMRGDKSWTVMESHFVNGKWTEPQPAPFSGKWRDLDPAMAPDGSFLLFVSNRPIAPGGKRLDAVDSHGKVYPGFGMNIWRVDRKGDGWGMPTRLPPTVNSSASTFAPSVAADGSVYFIGHDEPGRPAHLLRSQYRDGHYLPAARVQIGDADARIRDPAVAPDESFIVFSIAHGKQPLRLAIAFHNKGGGWSKPVDLDDGVNDKQYAMGSQLGPDHRTLYFYSPRIDPNGPTGKHTWNNGDANIWSVSLAPWLNREGNHS